MKLTEKIKDIFQWISLGVTAVLGIVMSVLYFKEKSENTEISTAATTEVIKTSVKEDEDRKEVVKSGEEIVATNKKLISRIDEVLKRKVSR